MITHVNYDNINNLLVGIAANLKIKIDSIDLTDQQKLQLSLIDKIIKTGDGTSFLSNDGTYKNIPLDKIDSINEDIGIIYDLLKIVNQQEQWDTNTYANMPTGRIYFDCIEYNGKIYCIGGYNTNIVEVYDINSNTWSTNYSNMPTPRQGLSCIEYNGKIYCIGGYNRSTLNIVEVYQLQYSHYDITLPLDISNKLSLLITNGDGTKLLTDNGTYQEYIPSGYREMSSDEMNTVINNIKNVM